MTGAAGTDSVFEEARGFADIREPDRVLEVLERRLRLLGATHVLLSGLPLPQRPVNKLILRVFWPDVRNDGYLLSLDSADAILVRCLCARRSFVVRGGEVVEDGMDRLEKRQKLGPSELLEACGRDTPVVAVPIHDLHPFQGSVIIAGKNIPTSAAERVALEFYCCAAFKRLQVTGRINGERPGDLSERERRVLELTAIGKTASEIADLLEISQRTVHAHLQNASEKLNASNKTHTVVEALRYGQISI